MAVEVKIKVEGKYSTHSVKANKNVDVTFKIPYSELTEYIKTIQMLNENVIIAGKIGSDKKPLKLGTFMVSAINIDRDGQGTFKINTQLDFANADHLNELATRTDEPLIIFMKANIELEDDQEEDTEDEDNEE